MTHDIKTIKNHSTEWSIKLGFKGELSNEFFEKWAHVITVRKRIVKDLKYSLLATATLSILILYRNISDGIGMFDDIFNMLILILLSVCVFSVIGNARVVYQYKMHDKEMVEKWEETKMNTLQDKLEKGI